MRAAFDITEPDARRALYLEAQRRRAIRQSGPSTDELLARIEGDMIPKVGDVHRAVTKEGTRWVALFTPRRSSKTTGMTQMASHIAIRTRDPVAVIPYISLTRVHAKAYFWAMLKELDRRLGLGLQFNEADLTAVAPGGTRIALYGLDDKTALEKVLGGKLPGAFIDEAQSQPAHLQEFIDTRLRPALADYAAPLFVGGTPHPACAGWFHELTKDAPPRSRTQSQAMPMWTVFRWDLRDNVKLPRPPEEVLAEELAACGGNESDPIYRMNWLGEWHRIAEALVYGGFSEDLNVYDGELPDGDWSYGIGVDIGLHDDDAFSVIAYSANHGTAYFVESWGRSGQDVTSTGDALEALLDKYGKRGQGVKTVVMDTGGLGAKIALELQNRRRLPVVAAQKARKLSNIALLNADLRAGHVRVHRQHAAELIHEWRTLPWEDMTKRDKEDPRASNHRADSALYIFREALHYLEPFRRKPAAPPPGTPEALRKEAEEHKREVLRRNAIRQRNIQRRWWKTA